MFASAKNGNVVSNYVLNVLTYFVRCKKFEKSFKKNLKKVLLEWKKGFIFAPAFVRKLNKIRN